MKMETKFNDSNSTELLNNKKKEIKNFTFVRTIQRNKKD